MGREEDRKEQRALDKQKKLLDAESPTLEFRFPTAYLAQWGPIINTHLSITDSHAQFLAQKGLPVPAPVSCRFLVDTGAHGSAVKHTFAIQAGLKLINDNAPIHGVGVDLTGKIYVGRIQFGAPSKRVKGAQHSMWVDAQIASGTLQDSTTIDGLIGRDVLQHFDLRVNGRTGEMTMRYLKP